MTHEIEVDVTDVTPRRVDVRLFAGEGMRFVFGGRPAEADMVVSIAEDAELAPMIEIIGTDIVPISAAALAVLPEGQTCLYNIWLTTPGHAQLVRHGAVTNEAAIAPV